MNIPSNTITLREAKLSDLKLLNYWDQKQHNIDADPNDDWNWEVELQKKPEWRSQFIAEENGRPIGFLQIIDPALEESHYWGDVPENLRAIDIWLGEETDLGKGYGTVIMRMAIAICFDNDKVDAILIDPLESNQRAHNFYEKLGFQYLKHQIFGSDYCRIYKMTRANWSQMK